MKNAPGAMSAISKFNLSFVDESRGVPETSAAGAEKKLAPPSSLTRPVAARTLTVPAVVNNPYPSRKPRPQDGKRVTVAYDGSVAPVLDIRFSAQTFADAGLILKKIDKASLLASTPEETSTGSSSDDTLQRPGLSRSRTAPAAALANPKPKLNPSPQLEPKPKQRRAEVTASQIGLAITTLSGSESDTNDSVKVKSAKSSNAKPTRNGSKLSRPPPNPLGRSRSQSVTSSQSKLHNPFADPSDSILNHSSGSDLLLDRRGSAAGTSEESLAAIRRISRKFPALPMTVETGGKVVSLSEVKKTISSSQTATGPVPKSNSSKSRTRSLSQPDPVKIPGTSQNPASIHPISPTNSTDGDVAIRTRRRLRTHMNNISPQTSITGTEDIQQSSVTAPSTATSLFSGRLTGNTMNGRQSGRGQEDQNWSPMTPYTVDSIYSEDEYSPNIIVERPIGHIARRALGIEKFLGEEKEKLEATSSDGHGINDRYAKRPDGSRHPPSVPIDVSDIQQYRASDVTFLSPVSSTYRVRPRSNVDSLFPGTVSARSTVLQPSPRQSQRGRKRSVTTVDDAAAREAFAAAWRTVVPGVASPSVSDLKNVNSVTVKKTPTLIMHRQVLSGTSMLVDEGYATYPNASMTSLVKETERGRERAISKTSTGEGAMDDRDLVRKARKMRAASVDSEVY
jgi:hypothetical protein